MLYWLEHAAREKLVMGLPAYSNDYGLYPNIVGKQVYTSAPRFRGPTRKIWLWYDRLSMYVYRKRDGIPHVFYASDAESTKAHLETETN